MRSCPDAINRGSYEPTAAGLCSSRPCWWRHSASCRRGHRSISPASGHRASGKISRSVFPARSLAITSGSRSTTPRACARRQLGCRNQTLPEWQCRPHMADYIWRGPSNLRISKEVDPASRTITAFHAEWLRSVDRVVYLDGRAHPPEGAMHTWAGFSTAKWEGDVLTVTTTHLKEGGTSPQRASAQRQRRRSSSTGSVTAISSRWRRSSPIRCTRPSRSSARRITNWMCISEVAPYPCGVVAEVDRPRGVIPHLLPGTNPYLHRVQHGLRNPVRRDARGPETMYPDAPRKLKAMPPPAKAAPARQGASNAR